MKNINENGVTGGHGERFSGRGIGGRLRFYGPYLLAEEELAFGLPGATQVAPEQ